MDSLTAYHGISGLMLLAGILLWFILSGLYLYFYPTRQAGELKRMWRLGASLKERKKHIWKSGGGIVLPGLVLGTTAGVFLVQRIMLSVLQRVIEDPIDAKDSGMQLLLSFRPGILALWGGFMLPFWLTVLFLATELLNRSMEKRSGR